MQKALLAHLSPFLKFLLTIFFSFSIFLLVFIIGIALAVPLFGVGFSELLKEVDPQNPANISLLKYLQTIQSIGLFIIPALLCGWLFYSTEETKSGFKLSSHFMLGSVIPVILIMIISVPVINFTIQINSYLSLPNFLSGVETWMRDSEKNAQVLTESFLNVKTFQGLLFNIVMMAVLPAIGEEFLFRGIVQRSLIEAFGNKHTGVIAASFLFSFLHLQFFGFLPRMLLGVFFGYLLIWSGNIWLPVLAHFINNSLAVISYYLFNNGSINLNPDKIGIEANTFYLPIISFLIGGYLIYIVYKKETNRYKNHVAVKAYK